VLLRLNDVRGVSNSYISQATEELRGGTAVTSFAGNAQLSEDVFTRRYAEGLPAEGER